MFTHIFLFLSTKFSININKWSRKQKRVKSSKKRIIFLEKFKLMKRSILRLIIWQILYGMYRKCSQQWKLILNSWIRLRFSMNHFDSESQPFASTLTVIQLYVKIIMPPTWRNFSQRFNFCTNNSKFINVSIFSDYRHVLIQQYDYFALHNAQRSA